MERHQRATRHYQPQKQHQFHQKRKISSQLEARLKRSLAVLLFVPLVIVILSSNSISNAQSLLDRYQNFSAQQSNAGQQQQQQFYPAQTATAPISSSPSSNYARIMQQQQAFMQQNCPVLASTNPRIVGMQQATSGPGPSSSYGPYAGAQQQQQQQPIQLEQVGGNCPVTKEGMLNVHIICHTHLDTGWVETFDQYYYGYVETIINSVVKSLLENPRRRFIFVETSFFMRWWRDQSDYMRSRFKKLVTNGQMEFISGGWSMNDEAVSHYTAIIDQMTLGHKALYRLFGQCGGVPKVGWQIDTFGHSREYASLLAQMGFDGLFLGRIDFQDKIFRQNMQSMEFVWKSSPSLGAYKNDLFTSILPNLYSPPDNFCFDVNCNDEQLNKYNVQHKATQFAAMMLKQGEFYATNHTLVTMGMDFYYRDANKWYTNLDMLIDEIQSNPQRYKINLVYSTPSCYLKNVHKQAHVSWSVKLDDFFPYADAHNSYWTGYFTSRPGLKYQIVLGNNFLQAAKQLSVLANPLANQDAALELEPLEEALGILQHHDAVTGTCKQFVNDDYSRMLAHAMKKAHHSLVTSVAKIIEHNWAGRAGGQTGANSMTPIDAFIMKGEHIFCSSLNASHCQISEKLDRFEKLLIHVYNPASHTVQHYVQIPVRDGRYLVRESSGQAPAIASQQTPIPPAVLRLTSIESRQDYGVIDPEVSKEFIFAAILPPLTMATFIIEKVGGTSAASLVPNAPQQYPKHTAAALLPRYAAHASNNNIVRRESLPTSSGDHVFGNSRISAIIDQNTGLLKAIQFGDGRRLPFKQNFYYYDADSKYRPEKNSGAYIFNPSDRGAQRVAPRADIEIVRGPVVDEVHQVFSPWCSQVIRIYKHSDYIEFHWLVGPIPVQADLANGQHLNGGAAAAATNPYQPTSDNGREIVSLYETDMKTNGTFFTDSNGRETIRRLRDHRSDYRLFTSEHTASNYYPVTSWIFIRDYERNLQLSILPDRPQGGSSIRDGQLELMLHRRLLQDDTLGVEEPLNEPGIDRRGLIIRGKHYLLIGPIDSVIRSTRQFSKQLHLHPIQWFQAPPVSMNLGQPPLQAQQPLLPSGGANNQATTGGAGEPAPASSNFGALSSNSMMTRFKFSGLRDYLPKMINLLTIESWDHENVLIRLEHIFEINEDADYSRPVQVSLRKMFRNFKVVKVRETTLNGLQDVEVARTNRLRFQTSTNPYKNYTDELGEFVNMDYVSHLIENTPINEDLFIVELRPMEIRTFLLQIHYI